MSIRDRILGDRGFTATPEDKDKVSIVELKSKIAALQKKLANKDKEFSKQANIEHVKLVDKVAALEKENRLLKTDNDKLKGREEQLMKEVNDVKEVIKPTKKPAPTKKK